MRNVILQSALGTLFLFLTGCATSQGNGVQQESDLAVLVMAVETLLPTREPAGDIKLAEDAVTTGDAWNLLLDLEDVDYLHETDKLRTVEFVRRAAVRIEQSRRPCSRWDRLWNLRECR